MFLWWNVHTVRYICVVCRVYLYFLLLFVVVAVLATIGHVCRIWTMNEKACVELLTGMFPSRCDICYFVELVLSIQQREFLPPVKLMRTSYFFNIGRVKSFFPTKPLPIMLMFISYYQRLHSLLQSLGTESGLQTEAMEDIQCITYLLIHPLIVMSMMVWIWLYIKVCATFRCHGLS